MCEWKLKLVLMHTLKFCLPEKAQFLDLSPIFSCETGVRPKYQTLKKTLNLGISVIFWKSLKYNPIKGG